MPENRRRFSRVAFKSDALLVLPDGERVVELLDLSLKGALLRLPTPAYIAVGSHCALRVLLDEYSAIHMHATVVHRAGDTLGLSSRDIDLDSMTHLRRLIGLNLGDEDLAEREFSMLGRA